MAVMDGMADRTPNFRASQLAAATTPRSRDPPTATGLPRIDTLFDRRVKRIYVDIDDLPLPLRGEGLAYA